MTKKQITETIRLTTSDVPLAPMEESRIDELRSLSVFSGLEPEFRESKFFRNILANHTRLVRYQDGDVIIREGEWGSSAFVVLDGAVHVAIEPLATVAAGAAGAGGVKRKNLASVVWDWWNKHRGPEFRDVATYGQGTSPTNADAAEARVYLHDVPAILESHQTLELTAGDEFGEIAALGRTPRSATCFASGEVELLEIRWQGLRDLMRKDQGFRREIDESFRRKALHSFLTNSPVFAHLEDDPVGLAELIQSARFHTYGDYDRVGTYRELAEEGARTNLANEPVIAAEGDYPNGIIMIRSGLARVTRKHYSGHLTVNYLGPGQVFGLDELRANFAADAQTTPLQHTLRAIGFISVITIPTVLVEKLLFEGRVEKAPPPVDARTPDQSEAPPKESEPPQADRGGLPSDFIEFIVRERFINGAETMVIDMDRCTRCDDCVKACAAAHDNNPRFVRQGPVHRQLMVANACMHCLDPVCLIECPTGAISRHANEGIVAINDTTCIGCSTCANNCPYDAIRMVEIRDEVGAFIRDAKSHQPIVKATKCDLCVEQLTGPACQHACPHDALVRIGMHDYQQIAAWRNR